ncbi:PepSY domain-containing protein [Vagococcus elongatus]|uniref:PepSY domain-containing protein n=1 Tax=Vagococcus elongatus TaxID=180344 RepID=A0A430B142_9ENTE|nr:PepSY domain-containing protein [Vagococcus elongatus]RSU14057.1 hypothetical protein CBF29_04010 [Vagococcus elongatus]
MKKMLVIGWLSFSLLFTGCAPKKSEQSNDKEASDVKETTEISIEDSTEETEKKDDNKVQVAPEGKENVRIQVTLEEAIAKYQSTFPGSDIISIELEEERGRYRYEIQGVDDDVEYELYIHAATGEVSDMETESLDDDERHGVERQREALDLTNLLSIEKAGEVAEAAIGEGQAVEWSLERDDGITYWEVKVRVGSSESSVKLDSKTGNVLEIDFDD